MKKGTALKEKRESALVILRKRNSQDVEKVGQAMSQISKEDLKATNSLSAFQERLVFLRENHMLGTKEIGEMLGFSHTAIQNLELSDYADNYHAEDNKHKHKKINRCTLEAFSLIYKVSPLYLIGKTDFSGDYGNAGKYDPMFNDDTVIVDMARCIIERLVESNIDLLIDFLKVSDYKFNHRQEIKKALLSTPLVKSIVKRGLKMEVIHKDWLRFCVIEQPRNRKFIGYCVQFFRRLGVLDFQLLEVMTFIALSDGDIQSKIHTFLNDMGYISPKYEFVHIDKLFKDENVAQAKITIEVKNEQFEQRIYDCSKPSETNPAHRILVKNFDFDSIGIIPDVSKT